MDVTTNIGFVICIGLPGSGKTTLTKRLSEYFTARVCNKNSQYAVHVIDYDALIPLSIQRGGEEVSWKAARKRVMEKVETLLLCLKDHTLLDPNEQHPNNTIIIIDDNMYYRSMRYEYFQLARSHGLSFCQLYLSCTTDEALKYNDTRTDSVPNDIVRRMSIRLQPPDMVHNNWEKNSLIIQSRDIDFTNICEFIKSSIAHPLSPNIQQNQTVVNPSKIHEADLELRRLVGTSIKEWRGSKDQLKDHATFLNSLRHNVLDKLRAGDTILPNENIREFLRQQMDYGDERS